MYRWENNEKNSVRNLQTNTSGIRPGTWQWDEYQAWIAGGGVTEPFDTRTPAQVLSDTKAEVWEKIKTERDRRMSGGAKVGSYWFHTDGKSRIQHLGLTIAAMQALQNGGTLETVLSPTPWKTMSGDKVPLTVSLAFSVFQAGVVLDGTLHAVAEQHKTDMEASPNPPSYDYSPGWPEAFEDGL